MTLVTKYVLATCLKSLCYLANYFTIRILYRNVGVNYMHACLSVLSLTYQVVYMHIQIVLPQEY